MILPVLLALTLLLWGLTAVKTLSALRRVPLLRSPDKNTGAWRVAVLVPARDEIDDLPRLLHGLEQQHEVELDVRIYDDRSSDGTAELLDREAARLPWLQVLHGQHEPPEGWCGKPHALDQLVQSYGGDAELFLFVDADVRLAPEAIAALCDALEAEQADVISALPRLELPSFWSRVLAPNFGAVATLGFAPHKVNDDDDATAFFNGQIVLMRREAYMQSGGFAAVASDVLEDVALARRLKAQGSRLRVFDGQRLISTLMYSSLAEHMQGWGKNIFALLGRSKPRALAVACFIVVMSWLPLSCGLVGLWMLAARQPMQGLLALAVYASVTVVQIGLRARGRAAPAYAPFAPLAALIVAATIVRSTRGGPVRWKGREYAA